MAQGGLEGCNKPVLVNLPAEVVDADAGTDHSVVLLSDGSVYCWGKNSNAECGLGYVENTSICRTDDVDTPKLVTIPEGVSVRRVYATHFNTFFTTCTVAS